MKPKKPRPRKPRERPDLRRLAAPPSADFYRLPELELRGGNLPQKLRKGQFRARHGSFERIQLLPLFAAAVRIALHGAAGQILPKHGKQMQ